MEPIEIIKEKLKNLEQTRNEALAEIRKGFPEILKQIFVEHPQIETIMWRQYTPYFNDGDECVFGLHSDYSSVEINGKDYYHDDNYKKEEDLFKSVSAVLELIPEEFYKELFGDHIEVTVYKNGEIKTEEYSHD